jgi:serine/threonine protein kinase
MTLEAGTRLGPYVIEASLGAGGMGEVYRAEDTRLDRIVAIKVLPEGFADDEKALARFEREAKAVAALSHPNILSIFDFGTIDGTAYAVMELLEGDSLRGKLSGGPLPARKAMEIAAQIARGLAAAHDKGIVHRDLKPENVFVTDDGQVKVLDFGLAKQAVSHEDKTIAMSQDLGGDVTAAGTVLGTVGYMSPEQVRGDEADSRSDIFSFGSILYEMISGQRAFRGDTAVETMSAILKEDPPELSTTGHVAPPGVDRIIHHCLEKNPAERFQSARDLAFDIESLTGVSSTAKLEPLHDRRRSRRTLQLVGGAALVALLAGVFGWWVHGRTSPAATDLSHVSVQQLTFGHRWIMNARFAPEAGTVVFSQQDSLGDSRIGVLRASAPEPVFLPFDHLHLLSVSSTGELAVLTNATYLGGHRLFTGTLARMPLAGGAPKELIGGVREADWSPDGSKLAITRRNGQTDQLEYPIGNVLHTSSGYLSDLRVSPDGKSIAFFEHPVIWDDRGVVKVVDIASGRVRALSGEFFLLEGLAWSHDGREILFSGLQEGEGVGAKTFAVTPDGKSMRAVLVGFGLDQLMDVGPDGKLLVLREETVKSIFVHRNGEERDRLLRTGASYYQLAMTADGSELCYTDERVEAGRYYSVILRKTDGSPAIRIGEGWCPDLSADGRWVLGVVTKEPPELWAYPTGPGQPIQLAPGLFSTLGAPSFYRDGRHVAVCGDLAKGGNDCIELSLEDQTSESLGVKDAFWVLPSPDGTEFLISDGAGVNPRLVRSKGEEERIPGFDPGREGLIGWAPTGRALRVVGGLPPNGFYVDRLSLEDGSRTRLLERRWPDAARTRYDGSADMGDDPANFAYAVRDSQSQLYVAKGVR